MTELLRKHWLPVFALDLRSLALFRVSLAGVLLFDLLRRLCGISAFYSDWGVLPRDWLALVNGPWRLSLYMANGEGWFAALLISLQILLALALLLGYRTRLALIASFVLLGSLHSRNPMVLIGGDNLLVCLLFWGMFLPLGARWSVDAALSTTPPPVDNRHLSWAGAGLLLQVLSVYFFSAAMKTGADWWPDGSAVYYALSLDRYATPLGVWLKGYPALTQALSYYVYFLEWIGPLLVLLPLFNVALRFTVMVNLMLMHLGFLVFLSIGHFPFVSLASLTVLCGGWLWDALQRRDERRNAGELRIYYDRDCGFCLKMCLLFQQFLILPRARIAPAQDTPRAKTLLEANTSWVVIDTDDQAYLKWPAFVVLLRRSPLLGWLWPLAQREIWVTPANRLYDFVGRHRGGFGRLTGLLLPRRDEHFATGVFAQRTAAIFVFAALAWNLCTVKVLPNGVLRLLNPPFRLLHIDQDWNMFAPFPSRDDGWFVVPGRLADGSEVDVLRPGEALSLEKPQYISVTHATPVRWRAYRARIWDHRFAEQRLYWARYLCRDWNAEADDAHKLLSLKIVYMLERTTPPGTEPQIEQRVIWRDHQCLAPAKAETEDVSVP